MDPKETQVYEYVKFIGSFKSLHTGNRKAFFVCCGLCVVFLLTCYLIVVVVIIFY